MAGSFADGTLPFYFLDLDEANRKLEWNPLPRDREATQHEWWDRVETVSESAQQRRKERCRSPASLQDAMEHAGRYAKSLAIYHGGRVILDAEDPGEHASNPDFWFARAEYYRLEHDRLQEEDYNRASRSVTPKVMNPVLWKTELDRAKGTAGNTAGLLVQFPAGKALLEAEDHGDSITDPDYWWGKEKFYRAQLKAEVERTRLERAKRSADREARDLATFPAGKALLDAENHGESLTDPGYWWNKRKYYEAEYDRLLEEFWERWKRTHLARGEASPQSLEHGESPPEASITSRPKTRARKSAPTEHRSARTTRSTTRRGNGTEQPPSKAIASSPKLSAGTNKTQDPRSTQRRQRKNKYRRQNAQAVEVKPPSPSQASSVIHRPQNDYVTPRSEESETQRSTIKGLYKGSTQKGRHKVKNKISDEEQKKSYSHSQNTYDTPSSPNASTVRARQRRKRKDVARQRRRLQGDGTFLGFKAVAQPISSRLRSSTDSKKREHSDIG